MDTDDFVKQITKRPGYRNQIVHLERLKARSARYWRLERPLPAPLQAAL